MKDWTPGRQILIPVLLLAVLATALFAWPVSAQPSSPVDVRIVPQSNSVRAGDPLVIAVVLNHAEGFHTWPSEGVALPDTVAEFAIRTEIQVSDPPEWVAQIDGIQWPAAHPGKVPDPTGENPTIEVPLYSGQAVAFLRVRVAPDAAPGGQTLNVSVSFQSCNEQMCAPPESPTLPVNLTILAAHAAAPAESNEPALFAAYKPDSIKAAAPTTPKPTPANAGAPPSPITPPADTPPPAPVPSAPSLFGYSFGGGVIVLFLVAALGGFILNLTPCVLPVIPIKVMTLTQHAGSPGRALVLGLWMALGVVAFWTLAGVPMALISRGLDPSRYIFGVWWIALGIGLIIAILGLGIMGLFQINLPNSVYALNPKVDKPSGSFLFGVLTAVLGLPCFGFVAGGLLAGASALPSSTIMVVFFGLGVGMAAPYLVLSAKPSLLNFLPKTGPASDLVKQVMGLLLLAAAAFFVGAGIKGVIHKMPYLAESMSWWAVTFFVAIAALWLTVRTIQIAKRPFFKVAMPVAGIAATVGFAVFTSGLTEIARQDYVRREAAASLAANSANGDAVRIITGAWVPYTADRLQKALAAGKIVVVDFTADWCINCKFLKRTVLDRDPVRSRIVNDRHVLLEVDCTDNAAPGWDYLQSLGQTGVPTLAIYGPGLARPVIMNAYTPANVMAGLDQAANTSTAASLRP